jgi:enoyl-CoA hydratase/carnithine racemase
LIGLGPARRLILSDEFIRGEEALRLGLIDHLVPTERFEAAVAEVFATYLNAPRTVSMASKHLMRRALDAPFETVYLESLPLLAECLTLPHVEGAKETWHRHAERRG